MASPTNKNDKNPNKKDKNSRHCQQQSHQCCKLSWKPKRTYDQKLLCCTGEWSKLCWPAGQHSQEVVHKNRHSCRMDCCSRWVQCQECTLQDLLATAWNVTHTKSWACGLSYHQVSFCTGSIKSSSRQWSTGEQWLGLDVCNSNTMSFMLGASRAGKNSMVVYQHAQLWDAQGVIPVHALCQRQCEERNPTTPWRLKTHEA